MDWNGAKLKLGPLSPIDLAPYGKPLIRLINFVNKKVVPIFEWVQYKAYFLNPIVVSQCAGTHLNLSKLGGPHLRHMGGRCKQQYSLYVHELVINFKAIV